MPQQAGVLRRNGNCCPSGTSLVVATHYVGDLPERITHGAWLRTARQGLVLQLAVQARSP